MVSSDLVQDAAEQESTRVGDDRLDGGTTTLDPMGANTLEDPIWQAC